MNLLGPPSLELVSHSAAYCSPLSQDSPSEFSLIKKSPLTKLLDIFNQILGHHHYATSEELEKNVIEKHQIDHKKRIGEGVYKIAYSCQDPNKIALIIAMSYSDEDVDEDAAKVLAQECKYLRRLDKAHTLPALIATYSSQDEKNLYFWMIEENFFPIPLKETLSIEKTQMVAYNALKSLISLHKEGVFHGDITRRNLGEKGLFDLSHALSLEEIKKGKTKNLYPPPYRPPECFFDKTRISFQSEMWVLGLALFRCAFYPLNFLPIPNKNIPEDVYLVALAMRFSERAIAEEFEVPFVEKNKIKWIHLPLKEDPNVKSFDSNFLDLIDRMLQIAPEKRISPKEALAHPFFHKQEEKKVG